MIRLEFEHYPGRIYQYYVWGYPAEPGDKFPQEIIDDYNRGRYSHLQSISTLPAFPFLTEEEALLFAMKWAGYTG